MLTIYTLSDLLCYFLQNRSLLIQNIPKRCLPYLPLANTLLAHYYLIVANVFVLQSYLTSEQHIFPRTFLGNARNINICPTESSKTCNTNVNGYSFKSFGKNRAPETTTYRTNWEISKGVMLSLNSLSCCSLRLGSKKAIYALMLFAGAGHFNASCEKARLWTP